MGCAVILACSAVGSVLTACGKPEDEIQSNTVNTPAPPYPAWSVGMIGKPLSAVVKGKANCKSVFDTVSATHVGAKPGSEVEGWAWDAAAKHGVQHVLIVDLNDRIIGAGDGGRPRPDVSAAHPDITDKFVGWHGVTAETTGAALAVGLGATGGQCSLSKALKLDGSVY